VKVKVERRMKKKEMNGAVVNGSKWGVGELNRELTLTFNLHSQSSTNYTDRLANTSSFHSSLAGILLRSRSLHAIYTYIYSSSSSSESPFSASPHVPSSFFSANSAPPADFIVSHTPSPPFSTSSISFRG
jgi:hypothetical protein